jgi:transposase
MSRGKSYTSEFKAEAIRLAATSGKSVAQVARDLGLSEGTLHNWVREARIHRELPVPEQEELSAAVKRLERENALLREEAAILKKAIGYFTGPPRK